MTEPSLTSIKLIFFFIDTIQKLLPSIRPLNPKILEDKYYSKNVEKLNKFYIKYKEDFEKIGTPEDYKFQAIIKPKLENKAKGYVFRSDLAWGRNIVQQYKSAWFNVLAGDYYELAEDYINAGAQYHFAGHTFRGLGNYRQAAKYYCKSTKCYEKSSKVNNAIRSGKRAIAIYRYETGQEEKADKLKIYLDKLKTENINDIVQDDCIIINN
jgi:tetratricopeptide (TPR) repeat protein